MPRPRQLAGPLAALALLLPAAPAVAQSELFNDFKGDGQINACSYSRGQLQNGLKGLPPDLEQYAPGFADQLRAALGAQCGGGAPPRTEAVPGPVATSGGEPGTRVPKPPVPKPAPRVRLGDAAAPPVTIAPAGTGAPGWLMLLGAAGALVLVGLAWARLSGFGAEHFTQPLRASFVEAGDRTADAAAVAWDLLRLHR